MARGAGSTRRRGASVRGVKNRVELERARRLFREYREYLATHREVTRFPDAILEKGLGGLDAEIATLPGEYAPPSGALLLAYRGGSPIGCGALRRWSPGVAEIKRVYVTPGRRGAGVGRRLTQALLRRARAVGYRRAVLDTLPTMIGAISLYRAMGLHPIAPYWAHPVPDALFFERRWSPAPARSRPDDRTRTGRARASSR